MRRGRDRQRVEHPGDGILRGRPGLEQARLPVVVLDDEIGEGSAGIDCKSHASTSPCMGMDQLAGCGAAAGGRQARHRSARAATAETSASASAAPNGSDSAIRPRRAM